MTAYYNEIDPFAVKWLRELIKAGHIAPGIVDDRSIEDVKPEELTEFTQCHFFAGIGVWSYALRLAGWPDDKPVWTGSCPCQPFSEAGKKQGFDDERHLWPAFAWLISQQKPSAVFGEQVASKSTGSWFDLVQTDLEAMDYAFGCVPFPSSGIGAPHIRDRAYWVAYANDTGPQGRQERGNGTNQRVIRPGGLVGGVAESNSDRCQTRSETAKTSRHGNTIKSNGGNNRPGQTNGFWRDVDWLGCRDNKWRPVEPGTFPLVDGAANRVVKLRGYGNAINAYAAKAFIEAAM